MDVDTQYPLVSETGKKYRLEYDDSGDALRIYESGAVYNETQKKLVDNRGESRITAENSAEYRQAYLDKMEKAAHDGLIQAVKDNVPLKGEADIFTVRRVLAYANAQTALAGGAGSVPAYKEAKRDMGIDVKTPLDTMIDAGMKQLGKELVDKILANTVQVTQYDDDNYSYRNHSEVIDVEAAD